MQKTIFRIVFFGVFGILCLAYLYHGLEGVLPDMATHKTLWILSIIVSMSMGEILFQFNKILDKWLPWNKSWSIRTLLGIVSNNALGLLLIVLVFYEWSGQENWATYANQFSDVAIKLTLILFCFSLIDHSISFTLYSYNEYAHEQIKKMAIDNEQMELQYEALKSQISPHYLFNSLNTIASLIHQDVARGEEFIRKLAETFKYVLQSKEHKVVPLEKELEFAQSYTYLLKVRHGEAIQLLVSPLEKSGTYMVPPFSIQILIENALKHNLISDENPLIINIGWQKNRVLISNNQTEKPPTVSSFKIGLENIRKRYAYFTDEPVIIQSNGDFRVSLPLLSQVEIQSA